MIYLPLHLISSNLSTCREEIGLSLYHTMPAHPRIIYDFLVITSSSYRSLVRPLLEYLDRTDEEHNDGQLATVLLPEIVPARGWHALLHNQGAWLVKTTLLYRRRQHGYQRTIIDVPFHLKR